MCRVWDMRTKVIFTIGAFAEADTGARMWAQLITCTLCLNAPLVLSQKLSLLGLTSALSCTRCKCTASLGTMILWHPFSPSPLTLR